MMDEITQQYLKSIIEAILFISEKPVAIEQIREVLEGVGATDIRSLILELTQEYEQNRRGMVISEIAGGYQMLSNPHYVSQVRNFFKKRVKEKLSKPSLETLAIVAYKQPVSRGDIELIRGVNSDGVVTHLIDKGLIKIVGRKDIPGRPYLYGTTKTFLEYFGLKSLPDLPKLEEFPTILPSEEGQDGSPGMVAPEPAEGHLADRIGDDQGFEETATPAQAQAGQDINNLYDRKDILSHQEENETVESTWQQEGTDSSLAESLQDIEGPAVENPSDLKKAIEDINREERSMSTGQEDEGIQN